MKWLKRRYYQIFSAVFFNLPFLSVYLKNVPVPVLNCYACPLASGACPIGTLQFFVMTGQFPYFTLGILTLFGILLGRFYCASLCPFGFIQDLLFKTNKIEKKTARWFSYLKYLILTIFVLILPFIFLSPIFCKICPAGTLEAGIPIVLIEYINKWTGSLPFGFSAILGLVGIFFLLKILLFLIFIVFSLFYKRPFCKICPLGTIFSFFNKIRIIKPIKKDLKLCTDCKACSFTCPAGLDPAVQLNHPDCIQCGECKKNTCGVFYS
ncbi:MAG TPA: 4Fe-4S binding protein [Spirochaetia bacterium]|nr:MAG: hypothetical protein A2Y41_12690 [Spirochaetes bacterium GWB1_36_13]HCL56331.1 4Fe-4S binding protein [Spirochaetia bacterium]